MNEIKVGKIIFNKWTGELININYNTFNVSQIYSRYCKSTGSYIKIFKFFYDKKYKVIFSNVSARYCSDFYILEKYYYDNNLILDFNSLEDAQQYIDKFLIKYNKMLPFM